jgi:hypothetical protein
VIEVTFRVLINDLMIHIATVVLIISCFHRQAEQFQVHGVNLKGKLTCGENIADLGGLKLALRALKGLSLSLL